MLDKRLYEAALDSGRLEARMTNGNWWRVRRNGQTKIWVSRPGHFRIPIKMGLKVTSSLTHDDNPDHFRILED